MLYLLLAIYDLLNLLLTMRYVLLAVDYQHFLNIFTITTTIFVNIAITIATTIQIMLMC